jgi:hypothetical protein
MIAADFFVTLGNWPAMQGPATIFEQPGAAA